MTKKGKKESNEVFNEEQLNSSEGSFLEPSKTKHIQSNIADKYHILTIVIDILVLFNEIRGNNRRGRGIKAQTNEFLH